MGEYSYKALRYGTANIGKFKHDVIRTKALQNYTKDLEIARKHRDALKKAVDSAPSSVSGRVEAAQAPGSSYCMTTHEMMRRFHEARALTFLDTVRTATTVGREAAKSDDEPGKGELPSLYTMHANEADHSMDKAHAYHVMLNAESALEAYSYKQMSNQLRESMYTTTDPDKSSEIMEAMNACETARSMFQRLGELHTMFAMEAERVLTGEPDFSDDPNVIKDEPTTTAHSFGNVQGTQSID